MKKFVLVAENRYLWSHFAIIGHALISQMTYTKKEIIIMEFLLLCIPSVNMQMLITLGCFMQKTWKI